MKKTIYLLLICSYVGLAQTVKFDLKSLRIPQSPALILLDKSFSSTETTSSTNEVNANLVNIKDNTVEVTPYWLFNKKKNFTMKEYYGVSYDAANNLSQNYFSNLKRISISLAYAPTDTLTSVSLGVRTNIINIKNLKKIASNNLEYKNYNADRNAYITGTAPGDAVTRMAKEIAGGSTPAVATVKLSDEYDNLLDASGAANKDNKAKIIDKLQNNYNNPIFNLDVAAGVSSFFKDNQSDTGRLGRYGVWMSCQVALPLDDTSDNFLNINGLGRVLNDKILFDFTSNNYEEKSYYDVGGKLEFQFKTLAISGEYLNRGGDVNDNKLVGVIEYKVNDSLFLSGGYGKNFDNPATGNLITLFGLKWGLFKQRQADITIK